jgi:hypothetical protein
MRRKRIKGQMALEELDGWIIWQMARKIEEETGHGTKKGSKRIRIWNDEKIQTFQRPNCKREAEGQPVLKEGIEGEVGR